MLTMNLPLIYIILLSHLGLHIIRLGPQLNYRRVLDRILIPSAFSSALWTMKLQLVHLC